MINWLIMNREYHKLEASSSRLKGTQAKPLIITVATERPPVKNAVNDVYFTEDPATVSSVFPSDSLTPETEETKTIPDSIYIEKDSYQEFARPFTEHEKPDSVYHHELDSQGRERAIPEEAIKESATSRKPAARGPSLEAIEAARKIIEKMSIEQKVGQMLFTVTDIHDRDGVEGLLKTGMIYD